MKKWILFLLLIISGTTFLRSQDLIITTDGDSIHAQIIRITKDHVFVKELRSKGFENSVLERANIAGYISNYSRFDYLEIEEFDNGIPPAFESSQQKYWKTSLSSGYSYQLGRIENNISPELEKHLHHLKHGFNVTLDFHRLGSAHGGAGMKASYFRSRNFSESGYIREITNILYTGISGIAFLSQNETPHQGIFIDASIGLLYARQHLHGVPEIYAEGNSVGGQIGIGVDLQILEDMSLFIKASLFAGSVRTIVIHFDKYSALLHREWKDRYSLSRIDLSGGIRF